MVSWHALGAGALVIIGILAAGFGALMVFAGGMSDAPASGSDVAGKGCVTLIGGLAVVALAIALMVRG